VPDDDTANHTPWIPCPAAWPDAESPEYVYRGMPLIVSCVEPSGRMIVPNVPLIIPVSDGSEPVTSTGGQVEAHPPVHTIVLPVSLVLWYSVRPVLFARTVPMPETESVWTESAVPDGEPPPDDVLPLLRPHAARSRAPRAITARPGRPLLW
jgi:hypothetical protein